MKQTYAVRRGGLMRCCLATLDEEILRRQQAGEMLMVDGDTLTCRYCKEDNMICKPCENGELRWQWSKPEERL